jgi:hypothetical protein
VSPVSGEGECGGLRSPVSRALSDQKRVLLIPRTTALSGQRVADQPGGTRQTVYNWFPFLIAETPGHLDHLSHWRIIKDAYDISPQKLGGLG